MKEHAVVNPSVVCLSSVTFVRPTHAIEIFVSTPSGILLYNLNYAYLAFVKSLRQYLCGSANF